MTGAREGEARRRMSRQDRHTDLLAAARELIRDSGTDEFTLARLAQRAGVTKPLVYDHFGDRAGVLAELYREFEARQRATLAAALASPRDLSELVDLVAGAYIDCCLAEGQEMADVVAALAGSPVLSALRQEAEDAYLSMTRAALEPVAGPIGAAGLRALIGAGDALARSALAGSVSAPEARESLARVITAVIPGDQTETTKERR